jgi:hypothetical protein
MVLLGGDDEALGARLDEALGARGTPHLLARTMDFDEVRRARAWAVLWIEPIPRAGTPAPAPRDLAPVLSAVTAAGCRLLVLVTAQAPGDPGPRALRRSGVPYVIVRAPRLVDLAAPPASAALRGKTVLVPRDVAEQADGTVSSLALVEAAMAAVHDDELVGRTIDVAPPAGGAWQEVLAAAGAKPRVARRGWVRVARLFGRPIVEARGGGLVISA